MALLCELCAAWARANLHEWNRGWSELWLPELLLSLNPLRGESLWERGHAAGWLQFSGLPGLAGKSTLNRIIRHNVCVFPAVAMMAVFSPGGKALSLLSQSPTVFHHCWWVDTAVRVADTRHIVTAFLVKLFWSTYKMCRTENNNFENHNGPKTCDLSWQLSTHAHLKIPV